MLPSSCYSQVAQSYFHSGSSTGCENRADEQQPQRSNRFCPSLSQEERGALCASCFPSSLLWSCSLLLALCCSTKFTNNPRRSEPLHTNTGWGEYGQRLKKGENGGKLWNWKTLKSETCGCAWMVLTCETKRRGENLSTISGFMTSFIDKEQTTAPSRSRQNPNWI